MKRNDYLLLAETLGYSYLFYQQNAGINFLIFTILFSITLVLKNKIVLKRVKWWWAFAISLFGAVGVLLNSSALAIIANCTGLLLLAGMSVNADTSFIFSFLFSLYSLASSVVWMIIDLVNRLNRKASGGEDGTREKNFRTLAILLVALFILIFFALYKQSNPLFAANTKWINLDFISIAWMAFTFGGFLLVYALFYHKTIPIAEGWENNLSARNAPNSNENARRSETEQFSGSILFTFLNLMLIVLNAGDITSIWFNAALPKGVSHSDFVHNGVGTIILSVIIAAGLIMFLYRKEVANNRYSVFLKLMMYLWVVQNLLMLFSTAIRNSIYIHDFNFTYRRIGVFIWLMLAAAGLILTFFKLLQRRSNWFLVKNNFAVWFTILGLSSIVNWDLLITRYNIANKPVKDVDFHYLFSLSDSNLPELLDVAKQKDFPFVKNAMRNYTDTRSYYYNENYMNLLYLKIYRYMRDYRSDWQSWDLRDERNINILIRK